jgi:RNA polymerase sigma factor (sigma-70 family)
VNRTGCDKPAKYFSADFEMSLVSAEIQECMPPRRIHALELTLDPNPARGEKRLQRDRQMEKQLLDYWFEKEVLPLEAMLLRFLRRNWRDKDEVYDILQEVYTRVYESAGHEPPRQVKPFVFSIARNLMIDRLRQMNVVPIEAVADFDQLNVLDDSPTPEQNVSARQELRLLQETLNTLPARCRQIVLLRKVEGVSQREVALKLGITEEVVEHQIAKAIRLLAQSMRSQRSQTVADAKRYLALKRRTHE